MRNFFAFIARPFVAFGHPLDSMLGHAGAGQDGVPFAHLYSRPASGIVLGVLLWGIYKKDEYFVNENGHRGAGVSPPTMQKYINPSQQRNIVRANVCLSISGWNLH